MRSPPLGRHLRDTEINQLRLRQAVSGAFGQVDVLGLQITMDDSLLIRGGERVRDRQQRSNRHHGTRFRRVCDEGAEILSRKMLHHDVRIVQFRPPEVQHANDRRVSEARGSAGLLKQTFADLWICSVLPDNFDRDLYVEFDRAGQPH